MTERVQAAPFRGVMARFASEHAVVDAAHALFGRGYRQLDAFVPRPVEALEALIAPARSKLPRAVFVAAVCGAIAAFGLQWYCNGWDYPLNVGGRPLLSIPAFIPVTFELMVLCGSLTTFFGVLWLMSLPHLTHPAFELTGFETVSSDQFWLYVAASDARFDRDEVSNMMHASGCVTCCELCGEPGEVSIRPVGTLPQPEGGPA